MTSKSKQTSKSKDWVAYYDSPHSIYVNALHRDVHYATIADEIARYVPSPSAAVLDYGCGTGDLPPGLPGPCSLRTVREIAGRQKSARGDHGKLRCGEWKAVRPS